MMNQAEKRFGADNPLYFATAEPVLNLLAEADASGAPVDVAAFPRVEGKFSTSEILTAIHDAGFAICDVEDEPDLPPMLLRGGRQYLQLKGEVDPDVVRYLSKFIDDLDARELLRDAGEWVREELSFAVRMGWGRDVLRDRFIPPRFKMEATDELAARFLDAATSLQTRLSNSQPAGCMAEEILAVRQMERAEFYFDSMVADGECSAEAAAAGKDALQGIFDLFDDDDVLGLFVLPEAIPAELRGEQEIGHYENEIESWFEPFYEDSPAAT